MYVNQVTNHLHMNRGSGETSYVMNSSLQKKVISITKPIIQEAILDILSPANTKLITPLINTKLCIADLGCSSGPNTLFLVSYIMDTVYTQCQQLNRASPEFLVFLNDLPGNDFNTLFMLLPSYYNTLKETKGDDFGPCFVAGVPGTFHGRLFPSESLHFVHSSYSIHWLSQVPRGIEANNKGNVFLAKSSSPTVIKAYFEQFQSDFSIFLMSRSKEVVQGGRMVLTLISRRSADPSSRDCSYIWELLAEALNDMVTEGMIKEEKLDSCNFPIYMPSPLEIKTAIESEGSFVINRLETFDLHWDSEYGTRSGVFDKHRSSTNVANSIRSVSESQLVNHFGEGINIEEMFRRYRDIIEDRMSKGETTNYVNVVVSMTRACIMK